MVLVKEAKERLAEVIAEHYNWSFDKITVKMFEHGQELVNSVDASSIKVEGMEIVIKLN